MIRVEYFLKKMAERGDRIRFDSAQPRTEGIRPDKKANPIRRINDSISLYKLILCG
jgi:hypothetical protein